MKPYKLVLIFAVVVSVLVGGLSVAIAAATTPIDFGEQKAILTVLTAGVELRADTDEDWVKITTETEVFPGDSVRTNDTGAAAINFFDQGELRLDANTEITIDSAAWDATTPDEFVGAIFLETGRLWSRLFEFLSPESSFEVRTGSTVATVRGTIFSVWARPDGSAGIYVDSHAVGVTVAGSDEPIVPEGELMIVGSDADGHPIARQRELDRDWIHWIERNRELDRQFDERIRERLRTRVREGGFTDFAERARLFLTQNPDRRDELARRFHIRKNVMKRTLERADHPLIESKDGMGMMMDEPAVDMEVTTETTITITTGEPNPSPSPAPVEPTPEPMVTDPEPEPVPEPTPEPEPAPTTPEPTPSYLYITGSDYSIPGGTNTKLYAYLVYSDDSKIDVSAEANWDVFDDPEFGEPAGYMVVNTFYGYDRGGISDVQATYTIGTTRYRDTITMTVFYNQTSPLY